MDRVEQQLVRLSRLGSRVTVLESKLKPVPLEFQK